MPFDVICPSCFSSHYETIDGVFDKDILVNPSMVRMKNPWKGWNWSGFSHDPGAGHGQMVCLGCDTPLAPAGRLMLGEFHKPEPEPVGEKVQEQPEKDISISESSNDGTESGTDGKSFVCPRCSKPFKHRSSLSRHMRTCSDAED